MLFFAKSLTTCKKKQPEKSVFWEKSIGDDIVIP